MMMQEWLAKIDNLQVLKSFLRAQAILDKHHRVAVSVSGGSDSDIVLDLVQKVKGDKDVQYIWFDTGIEYEATRNHLKYLEDKYGIQIQRIRAEKPIPLCVKENGKPFLSKYVSGTIERLQRHNFKWENKPVEELLKEYPKCQQGVKWWCNANRVGKGYKTTMFNINYNRGLKEFMIANPPTFRISAKCCTYAKKNVSKHFMEANRIDLMVLGLRRAEGGIRAGIYKSCFTDNKGQTADQYRPLFFYADGDKTYYEGMFKVRHSDCYLKYGFRRTGCVGCPFALDFEENLDRTQRFEPKLYKACVSIFGESYEYTRAYRAYRQKLKETEQSGGQMYLFD